MKAYILWFRRYPAHIFLVVIAITFGGCLEPRPQAHKTDHRRESSRIPDRSIHIYPDRPPIVNRESVEHLLTQLGCSKIILWIFHGIDENASQWASKLAKSQEQLRRTNIRIAALYAGPPSDWDTVLVPMFRGIHANFICAVIEPPAKASLAAWLTGDPRQLKSGLYVVDRCKRVTDRYYLTSDNLEQWMTQLAKGETQSNISRTESQTRFHARIRLIELSTGKVLAHAVSDAIRLEAVADDLAAQLSNQMKAPHTVAVLPFRWVSQSEPNLRDRLALGKLLSRQLAARYEWPSVIEPEITLKILRKNDLTPMAVEFAPSRLAERASWEWIIVGSLRFSQS